MLVSIVGSGLSFEPGSVPAERTSPKHRVVGRMQQFFVGENGSDALLPMNTTQFEFGLNYYLIDGLKASSATAGNSALQERANSTGSSSGRGACADTRNTHGSCQFTPPSAMAKTMKE